MFAIALSENSICIQNTHNESSYARQIVLTTQD